MIFNSIIFAWVFLLSQQVNVTADTVYDDVKVQLMYFIEPYLSGAKIHGERMEGLERLTAPNLLINSMKRYVNKLEKYGSIHEIEKTAISSFVERLQIGVKLAEKVNDYQSDFSDKKVLLRDALKMQASFLTDLKKSKDRTAIVPFSWLGNGPHAVAMKIHWNQVGDTYDLVIFNTGSGVLHHPFAKDPDEVYPFLNRLWIEFKNIPGSEIFDDVAWFIHALLLIDDMDSCILIEKEVSMPQYFYQTILSNFSKYVEKPTAEELEHLTAPMQASGSCGMSSLMAAFHYHCIQKEEDSYYYLYRLKFGHHFLGEFLDKYEHRSDFLNIITDGFETIGRNLFNKAASATAKQLLQYLEHAHPTIFKHYGLLGLNRSKWIETNKGAAVKFLQDKKNDDVLTLFKQTINLSTRLLTILSQNPLKKDNNLIAIKDVLRRCAIKPITLNQEDSKTFRNKWRKIDVNGDYFVKVSGRKFEKVDDIVKELISFKNEAFSVDFDSFSIQVLDIFQRAGKNWWNHIRSSQSHSDMINLLESLKKIIDQILVINAKFNSFEHLVLLAHIQMATWEAAVRYDDLFLSKDKRLNLSTLSPPRTLQNCIFNAKLLYKNFDNLTAINVFSSQSVNMFKSLIEESEKSKNIESFVHPFEMLTKYSDTLDPIFQISFIHHTLKNFPLNQDMYKKMSDHQAVKDKLKQNYNSDAKWLGKTGPLKLFFTDIYFMQNNFPHFEHLTHILTGIFLSPILTRLVNNSALGNWAYEVKNSFDSIQFLWFVNQFKFKIENTTPAGHILKNYTLSTDLFYAIRHSEASMNPNNVTNIESWLNFVKNSTSSIIFDDPRFMKLTNHILNVPLLAKYQNNSDYINLTVKSMYPIGFNDQIVKEIYTSLMAVITKDLTIFSKEWSKLKLWNRLNEITFELLDKSIEISTILIRFIDRIENDQLVPAESSALMLANLYNLLQPHSETFSDSNISMEKFSSIHLALAHISDVPLRNSASFLEHLNIETRGLQPKRQTLAKFHWFLAKMYYMVGSNNCQMTDAQYKYGIVNYPLEENNLFMEALLKKYFLPTIFHTQNFLRDDTTSFKYFLDGNIIEIKQEFSKGNHHVTSGEMNQETETLTVVVQLSAGIYFVNNEILKLGKCLALNQGTFQDYFSKNDISEASQEGKFYQINDKSVYTLNSFKGTSESIIFTTGHDHSKIFRLWKNPSTNESCWYQHISPKEQMYSKFMESTGFKWFKNVKLYGRSLIAPLKYELAFIENGSEKAMVRAVIDEKNEMKFFVSDFENINGWTILDEKHMVQFTHEIHFRAVVKHENEIIVAKTDQNKIVVIYPRIRLSEDLDRPLTIFESSTMPLEFKILNRDDLTIEPDQSVFGNAGLPGGLLVRSGLKKYMMLPLNNSDLRDDDLSIVEFIPIIDDLPAPQTRLQILLMSYYCMSAFEYRLAKDLLNPLKSLHQNEVFTVEELKVLSWILSAKGQGPEALFIKTMVYMHIMINMDKFRIDYTELNGNKNSSAHLKPELVSSVSNDILLNYLMSIRDLSEKYYIFNIFPEILSSNYWERIFKSFPASFEGLKPVELEKSITIYKMCDAKEMASNTIKLGSVVDKNFFFQLNHPNTKIDKEFQKIWSRFIPRQANSDSVINEYLFISYCSIKSPDIWKPFKDAYKKENFDLCNQHLKDIMKICAEKYKDDFIGFHFETSSNTDITSIWRVFKEELKMKLFPSDSIQFESENENSDSDDFVIKSDFLDQFESLRKELISFGKNSNSNNSQNVEIADFFNTSMQDRCKILSKLSKSIKDFTEEQKTRMTTEIMAKNSKMILKTIVAIVDLIDKALIDFGTSKKQTEDWLKLLTITSSDVSLENKTTEKTLELLNRLMHTKKVKTFDDLYACYLNNSLRCFQKKFLHLSENECVELQRTTFSFYSRQVLYDHLLFIKEKAVLILNSLNNGNDEFSATSEDLESFCDELKKISDFKSRHLNPVILNFEFRSKKYRLRSEQVQDIKLLTSIDPNTQNYSSTVIQRMMAAGKTLVLGTISIVQKATRRGKLSILIPPSSLYQSNTTAMQERTYKYFKIAGSNFSFPRFPVPTIFSKNSLLIESTIHEYLDHVIELLNRTMETGNYLILSPDSLQSFHNSYVEFLVSVSEGYNGMALQIIPKYAIIYNIFRMKGTIILDEIDMTMDPRKELNFPTVEEEPYNMMAVSLMTDIFEFITFDAEIKAAGLDILGNNQASLTSIGYNKCRELILDYIEKQLDEITSIWTNFFFDDQELVGVLKPSDIMKFLRNSKMDAEVDWIQEMLKVLPRIVIDSIIIIKIQLYYYLEDSLRGTVNHNYGGAGDVRPEIKYAVPYVAANTPSPTSVFADRWETLNKTLLMNISAPCSVDTVKEIIKYLRRAIFGDFNLYDHTVAARMYSNLKLLLPEIRSKNLNSSDAKQVKMIYHALNRKSPAALRIISSFLLKEVISTMKFRTEQITSNALNMASMFGSIQGYSGTIDNVNILSQEVVANAYADNLNNEKNNGGISLKLIKDCNNEIVPEIGKEVFKEPIRSLIHQIISKQPSEVIENLSAIIDAGAFFKNFTNIQVAEEILQEFSRIEAVIYYDETSNQLEFIRRLGTSYFRGFLSGSDPDYITKTTQVDIHNRFTFYDQRHITGSDILQPKYAHAIMTVASRVLLRDILQGTLRMRQFMTSQQVHLVTTTSTREFYYNQCCQIMPSFERKSDVRVSDILTLGSLNEEEKQRNENEKLAYLKIDNEIRTFILSEISREIVADGCDESQIYNIICYLFRPSKSIFVRSLKEDPLKWLQSVDIVQTDISLKQYKDLRLKNFQLYNYYKPGHQQPLKDLSGKIDSMIANTTRNDPASLLFYLPENIERREGMSGLGTEVQMEMLNLSQVDLNLDQIVEEKKWGISEARHQLINLTDLESLKSAKVENSEAYVSLYHVLHDKSVSKINKPLFEAASLSKGHRVGISMNLLKLYSNELENFQLFSRYTRDGTHLLVQVLTNYSNQSTGVSVFLLSIENARSIYDQLTVSTNSYTSYFWLCDLSGRVTATNDLETINRNVLEFIPESRVPIFDALIFNGSLIQILSDSRLYGIYKNNFLKGADIKNRASFLMHRMKTLRNKDAVMFDKKNREIINLQKIIKKGKVGSNICIEGFYPKPAILSAVEMQFNSAIGFDREKFNSEFASFTKQKQEKSSFDLKSALLEIFGNPTGLDLECTSLPSFTRFENYYGIEKNLDSTKLENILTPSPTPLTVKNKKWDHIPHMAEDDKEVIDVNIIFENFNDYLKNVQVEDDAVNLFDDDDGDEDEKDSESELEFKKFDFIFEKDDESDDNIFDDNIFDDNNYYYYYLLFIVVFIVVVGLVSVVALLVFYINYKKENDEDNGNEIESEPENQLDTENNDESGNININLDNNEFAAV